MKTTTTVLFDFDGTLADTQELGRTVLNALADEFHFVPITPEEMPTLRQMSARDVLTKRVGIPLWRVFTVRRFEARGREELRKHVDTIQVFVGIPELIIRLRDTGMQVGIVTSNETSIVEQVLRRAQMEVDFIHAGSRVLGKRRAIKGALKDYRLAPELAVYIGDELRDVEACRANGLSMIGVAWGCNTPDVLAAAGIDVARTPDELFGKISEDPHVMKN